jgi:hypothetical protein
MYPNFNQTFYKGDVLMTNPCGMTGPLHNDTDKKQLTPGGEVSTMRTLYPEVEESSIEKTSGKGKDKKIEKIVKKVKDTVRDFVIASTNEAAAKEQKEEAAKLLRAYVGEVRDRNAYNKDYQKTYRVAGIVATSGIQYGAQVAQQDRVTLPKKEEDMAVVKKIVGKEAFEKLFSKEIKISIKKEGLENKAQSKELAQALVDKFGNDGLKKYFTKEEVWSAKEGFDKAQYDLDDATRKLLLNQVTLYADLVSDASFDPKNHI